MQVPDGADHAPKVIGMVRPVDVALLRQEEETIGVLRQDPQGGEHGVLEEWILDGGPGQEGRARQVMGQG